MSEALPVSPLSVRPTFARIDCDSLRDNLLALQSLCRVPVWGVVKADGYGHGACEIARVLEKTGVAGLCVSLLEEAVELREAGVAVPILVMGGNYQGAFDELIEHRLIPVVSREDQLRDCAAAVRRRGGDPLAVDLKLDTGMARLGAPSEQWSSLASLVQQTPEVQLRGLMTHLACAGQDAQSVERQLVSFASGSAPFQSFAPRSLTRHAANTAGAIAHPASRLDSVRIGIGLYGYAPGVAPTCPVPSLQQVMRVRTEVVALRTLQRGEAVGYGSSFRAPERCQIATIAMGYADGLSRSLSSCGELLVHGVRVPIVGAVSMDMTSLDVSRVPGVQLGDEVVFLGEQQGAMGSDCISAEEIAQHAGTISWEVLTSISRRVPRRYS